MGQLAFSDVTPDAPPWRFKPVDADLEAIYERGFSVAELFSPNGRPAPGIVTTQDGFAISWDADDAASKVTALLATETEADARRLFRLCSTSQWSYSTAKSELSRGKWRDLISPISYRPFDTRFTIYDPNVAVHRRDRVMRHFVAGENIGLTTGRSNKNPEADHFLVTNQIMETKFSESSTQSVVFPLYLYPEENTFETERRLNFDPKIYEKIRETSKLDSDLIHELITKNNAGKPDELIVFDYIYGVLYAPIYRATFAQFLKENYPRIPYPASPKGFAQVAEKGGQLRRLHLMEDAAIGETPYPFRGEGAGEVEKPEFKDNKVFINQHQWFDAVPAIAWRFHIGGYQPAQKWLKDRKGHTLSFDDVRHYQKIIKILAETDRIMKEIKLPLD